MCRERLSSEMRWAVGSRGFQYSCKPFCSLEQMLFSAVLRLAVRRVLPTADLKPKRHAAEDLYFPYYQSAMTAI